MEPSFCMVAFVEFIELDEFIDGTSSSGKTRMLVRQKRVSCLVSGLADKLDLRFLTV